MSDHEQDNSRPDDQDDSADDLTPPDLQPGEDNPLAEPLDPDEALDDLDVLGGKLPEDDGDDRGAEEETGSEEE